ncbi:Rv3235 family protein [Actinotalea solisilvae]|uniref:Rv3235 family protein n=1 Tax=Actinotalea solisilvae TaxID=2072922 RepID=UPI0018F273B7|nr:Rv3235 family protein [Actinotalea solisilvae]
MTALAAATVVPPTRTARPAPPAAVRRLRTAGPGAAPPLPRLLLPPVTEPAGRATARDAAALQAPMLRRVTSPVTETYWPVPAPAPADDVAPDPTRLCGSVVLAAVEALAGGRPVLQLARWVGPAVYESLARHCPPPGGSLARRPTVRSTVLSRVGPTVAEASVVVHDGTRVRAAAVRMELHRGTWCATVLQIG